MGTPHDGKPWPISLSGSAQRIWLRCSQLECHVEDDSPRPMAPLRTGQMKVTKPAPTNN